LIVAAFITQIIGISLLYQSWRKSNRQPSANAIAWLVIIASLWPWQEAMGLEYGISFWFMGLPPIAWVLIISNREFQKREAPPRIRKQARPDRKHLTHAALKTIIAGPFTFVTCFLCSSFISLAVKQSMGLVEADQLILNLSLLLLFWSISIFWLIAKPVEWRSTFFLLTFTLSGSLWLYG